MTTNPTDRYGEPITQDDVKFLIEEIREAITLLRQGRAGLVEPRLIAVLNGLGGEPPPRPTGADD